MSFITITCPHCGFAKDTPKARVPLHDVQVTCPQCKQGFLFSLGKQSSSATCETGNAIPAVEELSPTVATVSSTPVKLVEPRVFYIKRQVKLLLTPAPVLTLLLPFFLPFNFSQLPMEGAIVLASLYCFILAATSYLVWQYWKPVLTLSARGIDYPLANPFKPVSLAWSQIEGVTIDERTVYGNTQTMARLVLAHDAKGMKELVIGLHILEGGEEALALLRQLIPEKKARDFANDLLRYKPVSTDTLIYRDLEIVREGIISRKGKQRTVVPWDSIVSIKTEGFVIAGYGSLVVQYRDNGTTKLLVIRASMSETYLDCVKLLLTNAKNAALDPGVMAILDYPVASAKADMIAILLVCSGVIIALAALIVLTFYPPTIASTWIYPLLLLPLCAAPFAWTIKLLSSRFKGEGVEPSRKIMSASLFNIGTAAAIAILFALSPASFIWLLADGNALLKRMETAEAHYLQAEPALAGNGDFLFTVAQFYARKNDWDKAARYYIRAYEKDPTNWMPQPLMQIPDSLCKAGRNEEALQWCDRIIGQYRPQKGVVRMFEKKKEEIKSRTAATTENPSSSAAKGKQEI